MTTTTTNTITNYKEQVNNSVINMFNLNTFPDLLAKAEAWDDMRFMTYNQETDEETEVFQWYLVEIYNEDEDADKLGIFFSELLQSYVMPVTHFGTAWDYVKPVDLTGYLW